MVLVNADGGVPHRLQAGSYLSTLSLALVIFFGASSAHAAITISSDKADGVYASGQQLTFVLKRDDASETAAGGSIKILKDNREAKITVSLRGDEKLQENTFTPQADGWYVCSATLTSDPKKPAASSGIVVNPDSFVPSSPAPADFDAFWSAQKKRLGADKRPAQLTPLTAEQRAIELVNPDHVKKVTGLEKDGCTAVNLEIPCADFQPVRAYYGLPKSPVKGGHPAILFFRAAGVDGGWCRSSMVNAISLANQHNALVVDMNAHGMLNGQPQEYYTALAKGELANYQNQGKESRDTFYFLGMFSRILKAIDFVAAQPEWDGKHIICIGISQGGAQALAAAGLDSRVTAVVATVPGMCDLTGALAGKPSGWPGLGDGKLDEAKTKAFIETVRYFDAVNFCARSKAETLVTVGLVDTTCSPPGVFTAFNQLRPAKRIITVADKGHHALSTPTPALKAEYDAFVTAHLKN